jgi:hypothetical protein
MGEVRGSIRVGVASTKERKNNNSGPLVGAGGAVLGDTGRIQEAWQSGCGRSGERV